MRGVSDRCPYCRSSYTAENPATVDHVFPESLGGRATVKACKSCNNNRFGSQVEGALQRPGTLLGFKQHVEGDAGKRVRGTVGPEGRPVDVDLINQSLRSTKPVTSHGDGKYTFQGSPEQVRAELERAAPKLGLTPEQIDNLMDSATQVDVSEGKVVTTLTYDLTAATKLAAKVALGSLVLARDDEAADSTLAGGLREIALGTVDIAKVQAAGLEPLAFVSQLAPDVATGNAVIYTGAGSGRTVVYVVINGQAMPPFGLVVDGGVPDGDMIATAVLDVVGGVKVVGVADTMASQLDAGSED